MVESQLASHGRACVLSQQPLIVATSVGAGAPLGLMSHPQAFVGRPATVLLFASSFTDSQKAKWRAQLVYRHRAFNLCHKILVFGSDEIETAYLRNAGLDAMQINPNCFVNETIFKPLSDRSVEFDAVYNARLSAQKRHELAIDVKSLALLFFRDKHSQTKAEFNEQFDYWRRKLSTATFVNPVVNRDCSLLSRAEVNENYARSRVGLILSAAEGANRASMEYLLAGLPVVSTRSIGGRDYFFDPEYCCVVDDDPRQVADAVSALVKRNISRQYIRDKTLRRLQRERDRFCEICAMHVSDGAVSASFLRGNLDRLIHQCDNGLFRWVSFAEFLRQQEETTRCEA